MTFSWTVRSSSSLPSCIMSPMERLSQRRSISLKLSTRSPATMTSPEVGFTRPARSLRTVLLPLPVAPRRTTNSPLRTESETRSTAAAPLKMTLAWRSSRRAASAIGAPSEFLNGEMTIDLAPEFCFFPQKIVRERMSVKPYFFHPHFEAVGRALGVHYR